MRGLEGEARLESYERLHGAAGEVDEGLFRKVLLGISCRDYEAAVEAVPGAIGLSKSTVSREFKKATARQLKAFQERELTELDVVALFLDGKTFANDEIVVALAVTMGGDKVFAGFVQTETENARVITSFLRSLKDRGLDLSAGALVVIDGAKGLKSAVTTVFRGQVLIQRCQWHKRENVVSYLPRTEQKAWRGRLQRADERPTYEEAKRDLKAMRAELDELNQSAVASLDEGFEETLTLHRLGVFPLVGRSLKTTNVLESVNAQAEQRCGSIPVARLMPQPERPEVTRVSTSFGIDSSVHSFHDIPDGSSLRTAGGPRDNHFVKPECRLGEVELRDRGLASGYAHLNFDRFVPEPLRGHGVCAGGHVRDLVGTVRLGQHSDIQVGNADLNGAQGLAGASVLRRASDDPLAFRRLNPNGEPEDRHEREESNYIQT